MINFKKVTSIVVMLSLILSACEKSPARREHDLKQALKEAKQKLKEEREQALERERKLKEETERKLREKNQELERVRLYCPLCQH